MHGSAHPKASRHRRWAIVWLSFLALAGVMAGHAAAQCENYESYLHWIQGVEIVGDPVDVVVQGNYAYVLDTMNGLNGALKIIDVSDPRAAHIVGTIGLAGVPVACDVRDTIAVVVCDGRVYTLDVSNPAVPGILASRGDFPGEITPALDLLVDGNLVYVSLGGMSSSLKILDIADLNTIAFVTEFHFSLKGNDLDLAGPRLYVTTGSSYNAVRVYDVSDPMNITYGGSFGVGQYDTVDTEIEGTMAVVAAGADGAFILDVSNPTPVQLGVFNPGGCADFVDIQGDYCYVSCTTEGITYLVDISDPAAPVQAGVITQVGTAQGIEVSGSHMFMTMQDYGLDIIAIADPEGLDPLGFLDTTGNSEDVFVSGNYAYVADGDAGLKIIDISDVFYPALAGSLSTAGYAEQLSVAGGVAYVAVRDAGLQSIDVTVPSAPLALNTLNTPGIAVGLTVVDSIAYVADSEAGLQLINISNPADMFIQFSLDTDGSAEGVAVSEGVAYVADRSGGLVACNVEDPSNPWIIRGTKGLPVTDALAVGAVGDRVYVTGTDSLLFVVDAADTSAITVLDQIACPDVVQDVALAGNFAYIASTASGMQVVDVTGDASPFIVGGVTIPSNSKGVHVSGDFAFVAADSAGLQICPIQCGTYQLVVAAFTPDTTLAFHPAPIQFTNESIGYALNFDWDFGDGIGSSQEPSPTYLYDQPGVFTVTLSAEGLANTDVITHDIEILSEAPWAPAVADVPGDQGGYVYVSFHRSGYDDTPLTKSVELYTIERKDAGTWVAVATTGAYGRETYTVLVPTLGDGAVSETGFRVIGHMTEGNWASATALGFSEDNIAPHVPANVDWIAADMLGWDPVPDSDLAYYRIYGGMTDTFAEADSLGATIGTNFTVPGENYSWYFVVAVDDAGLASEPGTPAPVSGVPNGVAALRLFEAVPNPFNPSTRLTYALPEDAKVRLTIYDASGRLVRLLVDEAQPAGRHGAVWDGCDGTGRAVSSGPYFYRLESGGRAMTGRMMLVK